MALEPKLERPRIRDAVGLKQIGVCLNKPLEERVLRDVSIQSTQDFAVVGTDDLDVVDGLMALHGFLETIPFLMHAEERDRPVAQWHHRLPDDASIAFHSEDATQFELLDLEG